MLAVAQFRTVKTEQKRPTFKAATYIHSPENRVRLPESDCIVIVLPAGPLNDAEGFRQDTSGNPYIVFNAQGVEFEVTDSNGQPQGIIGINPGCVSVRTSFREHVS